jgi:hypothetical protein
MFGRRWSWFDFAGWRRALWLSDYCFRRYRRRSERRLKFDLYNGILLSRVGIILSNLLPQIRLSVHRLNLYILLYSISLLLVSLFSLYLWQWRMSYLSLDLWIILLRFLLSLRLYLRLLSYFLDKDWFETWRRNRLSGFGRRRA